MKFEALTFTDYYILYLISLLALKQLLLLRISLMPVKNYIRMFLSFIFIGIFYS